MRSPAVSPSCSAPGQRQIARGQPGRDGSLRFHFARGNPAYQKLVSNPGLKATIVLDRATATIMNVKFHGRRT
jgi:hypothetical protein